MLGGAGRWVASGGGTAAIRREVWRRDGRCCTFEDPSGRRCCERAGIETRERRRTDVRFRRFVAFRLRSGFVGKVVNLNKFRKRKAKVDREKKAETNRRLHGRTKLERQRDELQKEQLTRGLLGKKLEKGPADTDGDV
jgi:hypothetical protein